MNDRRQSDESVSQKCMGLRYYGSMTQSQIDAKSIASAPSIDEIGAIVRRALDEDLGDGDVTTESTVAADARLHGEFIAKQRGVVAGLEVAQLVLASLDAQQQFAQCVADGEQVEQGRVSAEVEVTNPDELRQALGIMPAVDRILLDNMSPDEMRAAVGVVNGRVPLEASGNVSLENVAQVAATGVDYISIGALTHSVRALDISLELTRVDGK